MTELRGESTHSLIFVRWQLHGQTMSEDPRARCPVPNVFLIVREV
jgi:hypothetical protein